jgi:Putative beta barrel porin-7 (BBP7)
MNSAVKMIFQILTLTLLTCSLHAETWLNNLMNEEYSFCPCLCNASQSSLKAEYLYWQIKGQPNIPPLLFTGTFDANVMPTLKTKGTKIVLGGDQTKRNWNSGGKLTFEYSFGGPLLWDMELSYMFLGKNTHSKSVHSNDFRDGEVLTSELPNQAFLAIPFFDVMANTNSSAFIAQPNAFAGKATLKTQYWLQGAEWNFTAKLTSDCNLLIKGLAGFRYWNFNDELKFRTDSPNLTQPDVFKTRDKFQATNSFYGVQIGLNAEYGYRCFSCLLKAKIAVGAMDQRLCIKGILLTNDFDNFNEVQSFQGGCFAFPTNIGYCDRWKFACMPEVNVNFRYQFCDCIGFNIGYNVLYVNQVLWAGNQVNPRINSSQALALTRDPFNNLTGMPQPTALFKSKDFWAQGLNVGFDINF